MPVACRPRAVEGVRRSEFRWPERNEERAVWHALLIVSRTGTSPRLLACQTSHVACEIILHDVGITVVVASPVVNDGLTREAPELKCQRCETPGELAGIPAK